MSKLETFELGIAWVLIGLSLFCVNSLLLQHEHRKVALRLAAFFAALAFNLSTSLLEVFVPDAENNSTALAYTLVTFPVNFMLAPLFWLYVRALTTEEPSKPVAYKFLHAFPILLGVVVALGIWVFPEETYAKLVAGDDDISGWPLVFVMGIGVMTLFLQVQIVGYLCVTVWMLKRYSTRLRELFATTESRELYWLWWISASVVFYSIFNIALTLEHVLNFSYLPIWILNSGWIDAIITASIIWVIALWGLRQKPGLSRVAQFGDLVPDEKTAESIKYERSALTPEHAKRIAKKIEAAMEHDLLHRDPNLSLWDLSNHIGVTSNYVSQTLNETLGASFFDFVNQARIKEAMRRIAASDQTVLEIAFDVGFNSRSPFYKAFKRETGMTPTRFKQTARSS
ncbi:MAG: helix-turn-helix domain-containing protein [Halocynthiibacter sp.]